MSNLFQELKRRNVLRVALVYVVVAWLSVQVADIMFESFGTPAWVMKTFIGFLGLGFPVAVVFAWALEITPEGLKLEKDVDRSKSITHETGKQLNYWVVGAMAVAIVYLVVDNYILDDGGPAPAQLADAGDSKYSIAVLPFVNMSNDPDNEYFSDGLSEELLNVLAKIENFRVAGRTSSFSFKGKDTDFQTIGEKLKVETILEGSVRKAGDQVRITAQLVNVKDGYHLWSETYDRKLDNIFEVQDEIATAVVAALKQTLLGEEDLAVIEHQPTENVEAYSHYLRGRFHMRGRTRGNLERAREEFQIATTLDPEYALAYSGIADTYSLDVDYGYRNFDDIKAPSEAALERAMVLDDGLAEVWASHGLFYGNSPTPDKGEAFLRRAVELNPNYAVAWMWLGGAVATSDVEEGQRHIQRAHALDPLHPVILQNMISWGQFLGDEALVDQKIQELLELDPDWDGIYRSVAFVQDLRGRWDEAIRWQMKALEKNPESFESMQAIGDYYIRLGDFDTGEEWLLRAAPMNPRHVGVTVSRAFLDYQRGDLAAALDRLNALFVEFPEDRELMGGIALMELWAGNNERARDLLIRVMTPEQGGEEWQVTGFNFWWGPYLAHVLYQDGSGGDADAIVADVLESINRMEKTGGGVHFLDTTRAAAHAAHGDRSNAIAVLRALADKGWPGSVWDEADPVLATLEDDLGYAALMDDLRAKRQAQLESLRAEGI